MRAEVIGIRKLGMVDDKNAQQFAVELRVGASDIQWFALGDYATLTKPRRRPSTERPK